MATKKITFDPSAGVPVASNLTIYTGADFKAIFSIVNTSDAIREVYRLKINHMTINETIYKIRKESLVEN